MSQPERTAVGTTHRDTTIDLDDQRRRRRGSGAPDDPDDPSPCAGIDLRWLAVQSPGDCRPALAALSSLPRGTWALGAASATGAARSSQVLGLPPPADPAAA